MSLGLFKNAVKPSVGTTTPVGDTATDGFTTIYTTPSGQASYLIECDIACTGLSGVQVSVRVKDSSASVKAYVVKSAPVPVGSAIQVIDGQKIVLEASDTLEVKCETAGSTVDVILSLVENVNQF